MKPSLIQCEKPICNKTKNVWPPFLLCKPALVFPEYTEWAEGHPYDRDCVTMLLGDGVVHQGAWWDVECVEDTGMFAVCERDKMSVALYSTLIHVLLSSLS